MLAAVTLVARSHRRGRGHQRARPRRCARQGALGRRSHPRRPERRRHREVRAARRGRHADFTFALVGRLEPRKGVDRALRALAEVPRARLDIVGDGESRTELEALARSLGLSERVAFHGYLADPRPVLARADAALASSRKEGLGIAFLEAMAMGLPLVTVPVGGLTEIVRDGETGHIAKDESPRAIAEAMNGLAQDRAHARALGTHAREDVVARYSLGAMRRGYERVYAELVR
ncbi:MAG: glycosyltransferase family 4 protein [Polyangiaceae bacterium]